MVHEGHEKRRLGIVGWISSHRFRTAPRQQPYAGIQWIRTTTWVKQNLIYRIDQISFGMGWREERTGLHEHEFIETRPHGYMRLFRTAPAARSVS
jgi:hypothetical protein